ncbi:MAG: serine/threonine-protein kinase [Myxococcota bacterium]|nr:serine/threonine-protein kinase [Myxococcota bacterium]
MIKLLGRGGMAEVWLAEQKGMRGFTRRVVIKQMLHHLAEDREFVRRFEDEARISALINNQNVVRIEDFGEEAGIPFLVMEYIEGDDLVVLSERAHARAETLPLRLILQIGIDIARGLHAVHHLKDFEGNPLNVVHRDVSPQNIMVDLEGRAKLLDFGVARAATNKVKTRVGILKGKIAYFSPEQSHGEPLDGRSDQFALAVVLWELMTGHRLFLGKSDIETLRRVRRGTVPPLKDSCPEISGGLIECMNKALHSDPLLRFANGDALAAHLERNLSELGGRLEGEALKQVLAPLSSGERSYLPSIPLPFADEDTSFSTISRTALRETGPTGSSESLDEDLSEDVLTRVSQPGFLADFEDKTLLSDRAIKPQVLQALRKLPEPENAQTLDGLRGDSLESIMEQDADHSTAGTPPTGTLNEATLVPEATLAPEYTEHSNMGGPWLSLALIALIAAICATLFLYFRA